MALRKIKLYGKLGKLCGKEWELDVSSVGEALRAINVNTKGKLEQYLSKEGALKYYKVCVRNKNNSISDKEINIPYESGDIYIIPTIKGSGKFGQIILGVVLIVVGAVINYVSFGSGSPIGTALIKMGIAVTLGGVAQLLMAPKISDNGEQRGSFLFQGNAISANQGAPVGIVYGRAIVAPMPICLSMDNIDENNYEGQIYNPS